jgi:Flp pilus assembly protein TadD
MGQSDVASEQIQRVPAGEPYDWFQRATELLAAGNSDAAAQLLAHLVAADPMSQSALEAYGRALFDARRFAEAGVAFAQLLEMAPANDYAHFGLGMSLWQAQEFTTARDHLAMAFVMKPENAEYSRALGQVKATLRARIAGGLPLNGPVNP